MIVLFTRYLGSGESLAYFQKKFGQVRKMTPALAFELALSAEASSYPGAPKIPVLGEDALPRLNDEHHKTAIGIADRAMPLLDGETLVEPDRLCVLADDIDGFKKGSLALKRVTNLSEALYFYPCASVVNGILYRQEVPDKLEERTLATIEGSRLESAPMAEFPVETATTPGIGAMLAMWILEQIASNVVSQIGTFAIEAAFKLMGVPDPLKEVDDTYERLAKLMRMQVREQFRQQVRIKLSAFDRLRRDFQGGMRTEEQLNKMYHEIRQITAWMENDERVPDRVVLLATVQAMYLAIMQERAEWYRLKDPERMKEFYRAFVNAAEQEARLLDRVYDEAIKARMYKISGLHNRFETEWPWGEYHIVFFVDTVWEEWGEDRPPPGSDWTRALYECAERDQHGNCIRRRIAEKSRDAVKTLEGTMAAYQRGIRTPLVKALDPVLGALAKFQELSRMQVPPPPPKPKP
jgi:hypothetical protein